MTRIVNVFAMLALMGALGRAQEEPSSGGAQVTASADDGSFLPLSLSGRVGRDQVQVYGYGGYDSAAKTGHFEATTEVRLFGPIALRGGAVYTSNGNTLKPLIGGRAQLLQESKLGVDASIGVFYKPDGFTEPEGEIEAVVGFDKHFGAVTGVLDLVYGQDAEGIARDGEVRAAALYRVNKRAQLGVDGRVRFDLGGASGAATGKPEYDIVAGPCGSYAIGQLALLGQVGVSVLGDIRTGVIALGGVGTVF